MRGSPGEACYDVARLANATRTGGLGGVVGLDLAGDEFHYNNSVGHVAGCFRYAKEELGLNTTVHAGEMAGPADVRSAVEVCARVHMAVSVSVLTLTRTRRGIRARSAVLAHAHVPTTALALTSAHPARP
jgi:adenosine deaminase